MAWSLSYGVSEVLYTFSFQLKWSSINHKLFIGMCCSCSQITDHPADRDWTLLTRQGHIECQCLVVIMHHWPLSPDSFVSFVSLFLTRCWLTLLSPLLSSAPPPSLLMALAAAQTNFGSDARPRTQQFLRELYTYNISTTSFLVLYHM